MTPSFLRPESVKYPTVLDERSIKLRLNVLKMLGASRRGHLGSAFSLIEILRVLYDDVLRYDCSNLNWNERDRFILSKGHGCLALYAILADKGFFDDSEFDKFCNFGGMLGGHPDHKIPGIEVSTGSLGHGLSIGLGFAMHGRRQKSSSKTVVVIGDGEANEGSIWEAAFSASKHRLDNLTVVMDYNKQQSYGPTNSIQDLEPLAEKWRAFGFEAIEVNGHDVKALQEVFLELPFSEGKPTVVICHTIKGKGIAYIENNPRWHHKSSLKDEEISSLYQKLQDVA